MEGCEGLGFARQDQQIVVKGEFIQPHHATGGVIVENKEVISLQLNQQNIIGHLVSAQADPITLTQVLPTSKKSSNITSILKSKVQGVDFYGDEVNVLGVFRHENDGHTYNREPRLCVNLEVVGDKFSVKSYFSKLEVLDASISDLYGTVEELNKLRNTKFCQGKKEDLVLPMLASFGNSKLLTALFLIEKISSGFVYRSRQCKSIVDIDGDICKSCKDFFDNLLYLDSEYSSEIKVDKQDAYHLDDNYGEPVQACFDDSSDDDIEGKLDSKTCSDTVDEGVKNPNEKSYHCDICNAKFKFRKTLLRHVENVHETRNACEKKETKKEKKYYCEEVDCVKTFTSLVRLNKHLKNTHNIDTRTELTSKAFQIVKCPFCQDEFKVAEGKLGNHRLRRHLKSVHMKLEDQDSWQLIMNEEATESVICQTCGKSYTNQATLESHVKLMHSDITEMESCHICGKSFKKGGSTLWGHIRTHEDGGHICPICGAKFKVKSYLQRHIKSHDPDCKRYECDICGDKFTRPYLMKQHQEFTHKKNLPFKCNECGKCLRSNTFLKIHMRSVHSKEKPFPCEVCGFRSSRVDNLNIHRTKVHHISIKITRSQLQQLVLEGKHPFCTNPNDIPAF